MKLAHSLLARKWYFGQSQKKALDYCVVDDARAGAADDDLEFQIVTDVQLGGTLLPQHKMNGDFGTAVVTGVELGEKLLLLDKGADDSEDVEDMKCEMMDYYELILNPSSFFKYTDLQQFQV